MSFTINTNLAAMTALQNLSNTGNQLSQSITRLSSGLRINSAADDPSGLISATSFQAQIGGVNQAITNSNDAINYVKTAEGALSQVSSLLQSARSLAVAAGNSGSLTPQQIQADQSQLNSIVSSITRIAQTTQYGTKNLLDGSSGVASSVTDGTNFSQISIGGTFGGAALTANSGVTVTVNSASTQASVTSAAVAADDTTAVGTADQFTINGTTFNVAATDNALSIRDMINKASTATGVTATAGTGDGKIVLTSTEYGSKGVINLSDAGGLLKGSAGFSSTTGTDGVLAVKIGTASALFTASKGASDGLTFTDANGNSITTTLAGNATSVANDTAGEVVVGTSQFQIGADAGQTVSLSIGNFAASQLGTSAVTGLSMNNLDLTTASGATNALKVIDAAISQVSSAQGDMGNFQTNVLQSNISSLQTAAQNMTATVSSIQDVDVASEMTNFTKLQILQQAGISVLAQANSNPQAVLKLLQ
ncbi:MAG TPA: flagellin [Fimbriimonadaceae bacterium]|nr:flagellin [Fimbriimonadaceae bacterium]